MKPSACLFNSATALQRVFIGNTSISETSTQLQRLGHMIRPALLNTQPHRRISSTPARHDEGYRSLMRAPRGGPAIKIKFGEGYKVRDEEIRYPMVVLKRSAADGGGISDPEATQRILKRINRETHSLILRVPPNPEEERPYAICQIVDKKAEYQATMEKKKRQKADKLSKVTKELEINWAVAPHDLSTKLKQLQSFLNKGYKVELRLAAQQKKSKKKASLAEMKAVMQTVDETIANIKGTKEYRPREGTVGQNSTVLIYLHGVKTEAAKEAESRASSPVESVPEEESLQV
ncbi:hypothetical protein QBC43DRAFT_308403 [Cladorrhinum sp. PSN259]|nr:hypothetical protein QBC43DRAFT_308403 [Cladorrhinum sp. PSN259]